MGVWDGGETRARRVVVLVVVVALLLHCLPANCVLLSMAAKAEVKDEMTKALRMRPPNIRIVDMTASSVVTV